MDYTRFKALSSSLIAKYGGEVTFIHKQLDTSRPQPGGYPTITVETPVKALRTNPTMQELQAGAVQLGDVLLWFRVPIWKSQTVAIRSCWMGKSGA